MWMWKTFKLVYIKPSHGPKSPKKRNKSENILALKVGCNIKK
jgi:hypothetical protein